jgi:hypothetical protein
MMLTPAFSKSARLRVTTVKSWTRAVAAIRLSLMGIARPAMRRLASRCAHLEPARWDLWGRYWVTGTSTRHRVSDRFRTHLEADTQVPDPHACHRTTCRVWNKAVESVSGWPPLRLSLPDYRRPRQSTTLTSFPLSLQEEFAAYIESLRGGDLFSDQAAQKAMAPSTVRQRGVELGLALSALVASGREPASIASLACLVEPTAFTIILRRYLKDPKTPRPFAHNLAWTLITLAKRWVRLDPAALDKLMELKGRLGPPAQRPYAEESDLAAYPGRPSHTREVAVPARATFKLGGTHRHRSAVPWRCRWLSQSRYSRSHPSESRTLPRCVLTGIW